MAPVLVCPECSTKHPLGEIGDRTAFPCTGCGRQLKVPAAAAVAVQTTPAEPPSMPPVRAQAPPEAEPEPRTRVLPVTTPAPPPPVVVTPPPPVPSAAESGNRDPVPPRWARFLLWIVAVPLAFIVVFALARALGMLTTNEISDVALAEGWGRFWPIARLIPFVALATAGFVQGGAFVIARLRARRWHDQGGGDPQSNGSRPRPSSRPRQSPRPRA